MGSGRYCFSPLAKYSRCTCVDEDDDVLELLALTAQSSSNCQIVLHLLSPILFYANLDILSFCSLRVVFLSSPRGDRMSIRHLLATPRHAQLELSSSLAPPLSRRHYLCIRLILALPVKVFSISFLIRSRHAFLCGLIVLPCDVSAAQLGEPPV